LNSALSQFGGIANLLTRGKSEDVSFLVDMTVPGHQPLEYDLRLAPRANGYSIFREILSQKRGHPEPFKHVDSSDKDIRYYEIDEESFVRANWHTTRGNFFVSVPKMFRSRRNARIWRRQPNTMFLMSAPCVSNSTAINP
jgi:predicted ATPase